MKNLNCEQLANRCDDVRELFDAGLGCDAEYEYAYEIAVLTSLARILRFIGAVKRIAPIAFGVLIGKILLSPLIEFLTM